MAYLISTNEVVSSYVCRCFVTHISCLVTDIRRHFSYHWQHS